MIVDRTYCSSSYLMFRNVVDEKCSFSKDLSPKIVNLDFSRISVQNGNDLEAALRQQMIELTKDGKAALALSGGIDSAILAKWMPSGSKAYTFQCIVPGKEVTNEVPQAAFYASECGLDQEAVEIIWDDFEKYAPILMRHKGAPIHSIEVQIYKAALKAKADGFDRLIFGENADIIYGGMNGLLEKDWLFGEFVNRYAYMMPYQVLKESQLILDPFREFENDGHIDGHKFINKYFRQEALGTYHNACEAAGVAFAGPYSRTKWIGQVDYARIREGDTKYLVREIFQRLYPQKAMPTKTPIPRPMNEWMADWEGPTRPEFWPHCTDNMSGDQKWMVWALERFLDMLEE